jgi:hypothetical protein
VERSTPRTNAMRGLLVMGSFAAALGAVFYLCWRTVEQLPRVSTSNSILETLVVEDSVVFTLAVGLALLALRT